MSRKHAAGVFFWQSDQEAEDERVAPEREPLVDAPRASAIRAAPHPARHLRRHGGRHPGRARDHADHLGHAHATGKVDIQNSADAANALRPVAGRFAFALVALGILGTGLLAVPVLAGSAAYTIGEARRWPVGLARQPLEAKAFYATLSAAAVIGTGLNFIGVNPMRALYWSAVLNCVVAVPALALMVGSRRIMGEFTVDAALRAVGWLAVGLMVASVAVMAATSI